MKFLLVDFAGPFQRLESTILFEQEVYKVQQSNKKMNVRRDTPCQKRLQSLSLWKTWSDWNPAKWVGHKKKSGSLMENEPLKIFH